MAIRGGKVSKMLLFEDDHQQEHKADGRARGRSAELIAERNEHLLYRFVYYRRENKEWRHEYLVQRIAGEFYLSESTVGQLIEDNAGELAEIKRDWPKLSELRQRWPWMMWNGDKDSRSRKQ